MFFTAKQIYKDFVLGDEKGLKKFYQGCSRRQKVACWVFFSGSFAIVALNFFLFQDFTPLKNLILLSVLLLVITIFESSRKRIEKRATAFVKTYTAVLVMMVYVCTAATAIAISLLMQMFKMST